MPRKYLVVGGVAGGATAAAKLRRDDESAEITVFERGADVSFANCGLPYHLAGEITDRNSLLLMTPQAFWDKYRIRVLTGHDVTAIDRAAKMVTVHSADGEGTWPYDALILSQGAQALTPPIPGIDGPQVFNLKTLPDMDAILTRLRNHAPKNAVVIGAGYIGLEAAEAFHRRGLAVTVVELAPHILPLLDDDVAALFTAPLPRERFAIITGHAVKAIGAATVTLDDGRTVAADLVLVAAGVRPEVTLAREAGLELGATGGVLVDRHLRSSDPTIYAVGDAAETFCRITGRRARIPLAGPANRQGRLAAINAAGGDVEYPGAAGTAIVRVFDRVAAATGLNLHTALSLGISIGTAMTLDGSHAGYYPGAEMVRSKLIFAQDDGRLLGAQVIGGDGVDKRIDVFATAIQAGLTVTDLQDLDLAYAPPFGSANDPVNVAGFVATHLARGDWASIDNPADLPKDAQLVDVRNPPELRDGMLAGAINLPLPELRERLDELDPARPVVVYCAKGLRGYLALRILKGRGFDPVFNLSGGYTRAVALGWSMTRR